jgi:hypothetical protein
MKWKGIVVSGWIVLALIAGVAMCFGDKGRFNIVRYQFCV